MSDTRIRFAPSPTGSLHVGGARTALFNYLFAKNKNGKFIIRIEDTDVERSTKESENTVLEDLKWLGLTWDEGPDVGGDCGPYRQSERLEIYKEHAEKLMKEGFAYYCYCTDEELEKKRQEALKKGQPPQYDGTCRNLSEEQVKKFKSEGRLAVIRFKKFTENIILDDLVRKQVEFKEGMVGDFVLIRSNGLPTYNFACVVDDSLMKISHVLRGEEHLSNTYRQLMIYKALKINPPKFGHLSLIQGKDADGNVSKLSKRHGATSLSYYKDMGYLIDALVNYLALLGWSAGDDQEIFSREDLIAKFSTDRISKSPSIFDPEKLNWMNGQYLRKLKEQEKIKLAKAELDKKGIKISENFEKIINSVWNNLEKLSDIEKEIQVFIEDLELSDAQLQNLKKYNKVDEVFKLLIDKIEKEKEVNAGVVSSILKQVGKEIGVKGKDLWMPFRIALTGEEHGPELVTIIDVFGKEKILERITKALRKMAT